MRQGLLSEPKASSGPAAMLLAVSRSPSSIPRRSPCPERCHLPLASFDYIRLSKPQINPRLHPLPERCHLPLASLHHIHLSKPQKTSPTASTPGAMPPSSGVPQPHPPLKTSKTSPPASTPGAMPPSSGVPQPHPPLKTSNVSPPASNAKSRRQKNLSHRHETPAFSFPGLP